VTGAALNADAAGRLDPALGGLAQAGSGFFPY
jgi:hypothetical protein